MIRYLELTSDHPETKYCLEIQVTPTEEGGTTPPPPHAWQASVVKDMVWDGKSGLTEAVVTGPGWAILIYGWQLLGEGLSLSEICDTMFMLSGAIGWVGKQAQLNAKLVCLGEGQWLIAQAITERCIKPRGPRCPHSIPPVSSSFTFCNQDQSPARPSTATEWWEMLRHEPRPSYQEWGWVSQKSWDQGKGWWEIWAAPPIAFTLTGSQVWEWLKFSINFLISVIKVQ